MLGNAAKPSTIQANNSPVLQAVPSSAEMPSNAVMPRDVAANCRLVMQDLPSMAIMPSNAAPTAGAAERSLPSNAPVVTGETGQHWWSDWWSSLGSK